MYLSGAKCISLS